MPSWVVPAVAAEFWAVSVEQVMADVAAGRVGTYIERGLLFVDVAPLAESAPAPTPAADPAPPRPPARRSLAWLVGGAQTVVTPAERDALLTLDDDPAGFDAAAAFETATEPRFHVSTAEEPPESVHDEGEPVPLPDGPEEAPTPMPITEGPPQWESIRARVSRLRKPPADSLR